MRRASRPRDDRGVAAVFFALAMVVLVASLGLSVDIGNVAYQRNNAQHGADLAARTLARSCATASSGAECTALQSSASTIVGQSFAGGTVQATRTASTAAVQVTVEKEIDTPLLAAIGVKSKSIKATATASGSGRPVSGTVALPLGVSYCTWKNNSQFAGTDTESQHRTAIRTDTLQSLRTMLSPLTATASTFLETGPFLDYIDTKVVDSCTQEDGTQLATFKGAVWLTGETVVTNIVKGLFGWDASKCELKTSNDLNTFLGGLQGSALLPQGCASQFGNGKPVDKGKTILLPVFKPSSSLQSHGLKLATSCASVLGSSSACVEVAPKLGVQIVGFAPFVVTGWTYPGNPSNTDASVACAPISTTYNVKSTLLKTLSLADLLLNAVFSSVNSILSQDLTASVGCNGLQGYFTKTLVKDPNFTYAPSSDEFGAKYIRLTQ
jgi:Flp pilus assembly protein TadG